MTTCFIRWTRAYFPIAMKMIDSTLNFVLIFFDKFFQFTIDWICWKPYIQHRWKIDVFDVPNQSKILAPIEHERERERLHTFFFYFVLLSIRNGEFILCRSDGWRLLKNHSWLNLITYDFSARTRKARANMGPHTHTLVVHHIFLWRRRQRQRRSRWVPMRWLRIWQNDKWENDTWAMSNEQQHGASCAYLCGMWSTHTLQYPDTRMGFSVWHRTRPWFEARFS